MDLIILTPDKKVFEGVVERVVFPGSEGRFEVLTQHAPLVAQLAAGSVDITMAERKTVSFKITSGFVEVLNNRLSVIAEAVTE